MQLPLAMCSSDAREKIIGEYEDARWSIGTMLGVSMIQNGHNISSTVPDPYIDAVRGLSTKSTNSEQAAFGSRCVIAKLADSGSPCFLIAG